MTPTPPLSVVMPLRNAAPYLDASIGSIVQQTFTDFELIILDDASSDASPALLELWARRDARIRLFLGGEHRGMVQAANFVVAQARAPIVARMDADDVSHRERLARQMEVMLRHPEIALAGTLSDGIDAGGARVRPRDGWRLVRRSATPPFPHGSIMFRRAAFEELGGYRQGDQPEDRDLFLRFAARYPVVVLPDVLYHYRYHVESATAGANTADAVTLRNAAAMRLWAGERPDVFRALWQRRARPQALVWAAWARLHPSTLRFVTRSIIRARDLVARIKFREGEAIPWRSE